MKQKTWDEEGVDKVGLKIVILEGFYTLVELEQAKQGQVEETLVAKLVSNFFDELELEIRMEIESKVGPLQKVDFFQYNPKGVCKLKFQSSVHAGDCI